MSLQNKGGPKKFSFGFPSKKASTEPPKRKAQEQLVDATKKSRSLATFDDEDELLASAGIGKPFFNNAGKGGYICLF